MARRVANRLGIFGGTFDPVHLGHVALVVALKEAHRLDRVYIIPANVNPHKGQPPQSANHRLKMLKTAFRGVPGCQVLDVELRRKGPSYTIDTVRQLQQNATFGPKDRLFLLLGEDQLEGLCNWKEADALLSIVKPIVARRFLGAATGAKVSQTPYFDISATQIRQRLKAGRYCGHLLDKAVYNYILKHKLYE